MSAIGPKQTSVLQTSAFGGKADMTASGYPLSRSLSGAKRTSLFAAHMSAYDPKRTFCSRSNLTLGSQSDSLFDWDHIKRLGACAGAHLAVLLPRSHMTMSGGSDKSIERAWRQF